MKKTSIRRGRTLSIRARVLSIALVPCFVFLLAGGGSAGYLIYDAASTRHYFDLASQAQRAALPLIMAVEEERRLTLRNLANAGTFEYELIEQRQQTDARLKPVRTTLAELTPVAPDSVRAAAGEVSTLMAQLPQLRTRVDEARISMNEAFTFYNTVVDEFIQGAQGVAQFAPDAEAVHNIGVTVGPLLTAADQMLRADALASANMAGGGLNQADFRQYQGLVSAYHLGLDKSLALAEPAIQEQYAQLKQSPSWQRLVSVENALLGGGTQLPITEDQWRAAAQDVGNSVMGMLTTQSRATMADAVDRLDTTLTRSIIAGAVVLLLAAAVFVFALRLSRRLIERLTRLRTETLDLAETKLPELVEKVRTGADVTVEDSVRLVDHGNDEIGEVADAFNKAQRTAVAAAVQEARTREGTNAVFLNIARRSQVIVHRQLKVLDEAERRQEDPEQLEMLFQLDHLSTRARRNAENLIILGGSQPGRRWRIPVSLTELTRGAAAETEDFARVKIAKLPPVAVNGPVVGDLVHLLAELIDNAASFSPPESRVDVRGNVVGKGVVLEIEDQGVGIEPARLDAFNDTLRHPPDFGIMALSDEPRLGLFVVARLAARHGIGVTLRESAYGGTRAIVLVRTELLTDVPTEEQPVPATLAAQAASPSGQPSSGPEPSAGPVTYASGQQPVTAASGQEKFTRAFGQQPVTAAFGQEPGAREQRPVTSAAGQEQSTPAFGQQPSTSASEQGQFTPASGQQPSISASEQERFTPTSGQEPAAPASGQPSTQPSTPASGQPALAAFMQPLPEFPVVVAQPGEDLFRPQRPVEEQPPRPAPAPQPPTPAPPPPVTNGTPADGRPPLPQRRRQQNLAPQLRSDPPPPDQEPTWPKEETVEDTPDAARSRLSAFALGTRRGREETGFGFEETNGNGVRNGQHRAE